MCLGPWPPYYRWPSGLHSPVGEVLLAGVDLQVLAARSWGVRCTRWSLLRCSGAPGHPIVTLAGSAEIFIFIFPELQKITHLKLYLFKIMNCSLFFSLNKKVQVGDCSLASPITGGCEEKCSGWVLCAVLIRVVQPKTWGTTVFIFLIFLYHQVIKRIQSFVKIQ